MKYLIFFPLVAILFAGCADQVSYEEIDAKQVFVLKCELEKDLAPTAVLQLTSLLDGTSTGGFVSTARIELIDGTDSKHVLMYDENLQKYVGVSGRIKVDRPYTVLVSDENYEGKDLIAETEFPSRITTDSISASYKATVNSKDQITVDLHLPTLNTTGAYLYIVPKRRRAIEENGQLGYLELEKVNIARVHNDNFVVQELFHMDGVLVDYQRLEDKVVTLDLESLPLEDGEITPSVHFDIISVTKDYYHYYISRSNQLRDARDLNGTPAINYSNIRNGLGLFGSKIVTRDSVLVK